MRFNWRLLEATLFEDLAALWNETLRCASEDKDPDAVDEAAFAGKRHRALSRSTVRAVYALIEGYLNGVALDTMIAGKALTAKEKGLLQEQRDGRFAPVSLRAKILKYPRIALSTGHPIYTEDHCAPLALILKLEREYRNSLDLLPKIRTRLSRIQREGGRDVEKQTH